MHKPSGIHLSGGPCQQVEVRCYAGGKADEKPREYRWQNRSALVKRVQFSWLERAHDKPDMFRCFMVEDENGRNLVLFQNEATGRWFLDWVMK